MLAPQQVLELRVHADGAVQKLPCHRLFFGDVRPTVVCIHLSDDGLNLVPKGCLVNEKKLKSVSLNLRVFLGGAAGQLHGHSKRTFHRNRDSFGVATSSPGDGQISRFHTLARQRRNRAGLALLPIPSYLFSSPCS